MFLFATGGTNFQRMSFLYFRECRHVVFGNRRTLYIRNMAHQFLNFEIMQIVAIILWVIVLLAIGACIMPWWFLPLLAIVGYYVSVLERKRR